MIKIIFLALILIITALILGNKIATNLFNSDKKKNYFYIFIFLLFLISIFSYRFIEMENYKGKYYPPKFDGKKITPGIITNE